MPRVLPLKLKCVEIAPAEGYCIVNLEMSCGNSMEFSTGDTLHLTTPADIAESISVGDELLVDIQLPGVVTE